MNTFGFALLTSAVLHTAAKGPLIECPLRWVVDGYGSVPRNAITCSEGTFEFIARIYQEPSDTWISGRIVPYLGKAYFANQDAVVEVSTYQVLVAPPYCNLAWRSGEGSFVPDFSVQVDNANAKLFVGRVADSKQSVCGCIDLDASGISVVDSNLSPVKYQKFQTLTSTYPELAAEVKNVKFDISQLSNSNCKNELIGQETITLGSSIQGSITSHRILHGKTITERFTFLEGFNWVGISNLSLSFSTFIGTSDITATLNVTDEDIELSVARDRELKVDTSHDISRPPGNNLPILQTEVCSVACILDDLEFPYTATIVYRSARLEAPQILNVLDKLGRPALIEGQIDGLMKGRFVLKTALHIEDPDPILICSKHR